MRLNFRVKLSSPPEFAGKCRSNPVAENIYLYISMSCGVKSGVRAGIDAKKSGVLHCDSM